MIRTRRSALLLVLTVAVLLGAALPANAQFSDTATPATGTSIGTLAVAGPGNVRVDTTCITTTTVIKRTYRAGNNALLSTSQTRSTNAAASNVESDTTVRSDGPLPSQYTVTRTIKDTMLYATALWDPSTSPGVTGYRMTVFFANGQTYPMNDVPASATQMDDSYDANVVDLGARLSMVTLTSYGWTAAGNLSNVVTC